MNTSSHSDYDNDNKDDNNDDDDDNVQLFWEVVSDVNVDVNCDCLGRYLKSIGQAGIWGDYLFKSWARWDDIETTADRHNQKQVSTNQNYELNPPKKHRVEVSYIYISSLFFSYFENLLSFFFLLFLITLHVLLPPPPSSPPINETISFGSLHLLW
jgi:hypothetical protein